jgi:hypothetical protein
LGREGMPDEQGREGGTVPEGNTRTFSAEETGRLARPIRCKEGALVKCLLLHFRVKASVFVKAACGKTARAV